MVVLFYDTNGIPQAVDVTDGSVHTLLTDSSGSPIEVDSVTGAHLTIDYAHHEIHAGNHFFYTDSVELDNAEVQDYLITTPNSTKWAHMLFNIDGSAITQFELYEGADRDGTTPQTLFNSNRNSLSTATITIYKGTNGGTTDGTRILIYKSGAATAVSRQSTQSRNDD